MHDNEDEGRGNGCLVFGIVCLLFLFMMSTCSNFDNIDRKLLEMEKQLDKIETNTRYIQR